MGIKTTKPEARFRIGSLVSVGGGRRRADLWRVVRYVRVANRGWAIVFRSLKDARERVVSLTKLERYAP
jgi:hypothetical protein